jgi:hypothetical protein
VAATACLGMPCEHFDDKFTRIMTKIGTTTTATTTTTTAATTLTIGCISRNHQHFLKVSLVKKCNNFHQGLFS